MNSFGNKLKVTTFGESHGVAIGCVVDGVPAGLAIDQHFLQSELDRRRPNKNRVGSTARDEADKCEIISGVFEGVSTGAPIAMIIYNSSQKTSDYDNLKNIFRPAHADFSWFMKYGVRDHRGGGRTSARESAARVAAGAVAKMMLKELNIEVLGGVYAVGSVVSDQLDFEYARTSPIFALDPTKEADQINEIEKARNDHDSIGAVAKVVANGVMAGLGEPLYDKLDALIAKEMMGINAVKAVEIGEGANASSLLGSQNNDQMKKGGFVSNKSGGILGGVSTGEQIVATVYFKPTPSIFKPQQTLDTNGDEVECLIKGRHDSCVGVRGVVVAEAMMALVIADSVLCNMGSKMSHLKSIYKENL